MDRLTDKEFKCMAGEKLKRSAVAIIEESKHQERMLKMLELERAEAEGRLIVLPCKVGDTVYKVVSVNVPDDDYRMSFHRETIVTPVLFNPSHILAVGKTIFLSREEAEAALEGGDGA